MPRALHRPLPAARLEDPAGADPPGTRYTFEFGVQKDIGGQGFADVWKKDHFGWEYKSVLNRFVDSSPPIGKTLQTFRNGNRESPLKVGGSP